MDDEPYFYMPSGYTRDTCYVLPEASKLKHDTTHPELNSIDFKYQISKHYEHPVDFLPFFCLLDIKDEIFAVGTNNLNSSVFDGNLIGAECFEAIASHDDIQKTVFQLSTQSTLTALKLLDSHLFMTATMNGVMQLWSSKSPYRDINKYNLYKCSQVNTDGCVCHIDRFNQESKQGSTVVVGTKKGHIDLFDFGLADVTNVLHIANAHSQGITGVSAHPTNKKWITCSTDRNCLLWDTSMKRPASSILSNYQHQLTAVRWTTPQENKSLVMIGDEVGNVLTLDPRNPNKILNEKRVTNRAIRMFSFNGTNKFGVIANKNVAGILEIEDSGELKEVHKHIAPGMIYAMCWDEKEKNTFYAVGEEKYAVKVSL